MTSTPDIPAEAVEAANQAMWEWFATTGETGTRMVLAAALPHLHAQWLAQAEAALRDEVRFLTWHSATRPHVDAATIAAICADYLREVLGAGADGEG